MSRSRRSAAPVAPSSSSSVPYSGGEPDASTTHAAAVAVAKFVEATRPQEPVDPDKRDAAILVQNYIATEFPKVLPLFKMEASKGVLKEIQQVVNSPRSLLSILAEYRQLKRRQMSHQQLLSAIGNFSKVHQAEGSIIQLALTNMANIANDYVHERERIAADPSMPTMANFTPDQLGAILAAVARTQQMAGMNPPAAVPAAVPTLVQQQFASSITIPMPTTANGMASAAAAQLPSPASASAPIAPPIPAPVTISTTENAVAALSAVKNRRKGSSPKKRVLIQEPPASFPSSAPPVASNGSPHDFLPYDLDAELGLPYQFPTAIPMPSFGEDVVAQFQINPEGYDSMMDLQGHGDAGAFPEALARYINQAAASSSSIARSHSDMFSNAITPSISNSGPPTAAAASSSAAAGGETLNPSPSPKLVFSHDMMLSIAEQCLQDPVAATFMDSAFQACIPTEDGLLSPDDGSMQAETGPNTPMPNAAGTGSPPRRTGSKPSTQSSPAAAASSAEPRRSPKGPNHAASGRPTRSTSNVSAAASSASSSILPPTHARPTRTTSTPGRKRKDAPEAEPGEDQQFKPQQPAPKTPENRVIHTATHHAPTTASSAPTAGADDMDISDSDLLAALQESNVDDILGTINEGAGGI